MKNGKKNWYNQNDLKREDKIGGLRLPNFLSYYKATISKTA